MRSPGAAWQEPPIPRSAKLPAPFPERLLGWMDNLL
jgi:hypothetical protein